MSFIENLRQWTSEQADKLTDQSNTYHRSSGKTDTEYEQDIRFYKNLEDATRKSAVILGALDGAAFGGLGTLASGASLPSVIGMAASQGYMGHLWPFLSAAYEKKWDNEKNGGRPYSGR